MKGPRPLPAFTTLARALRSTTERLARELSAPGAEAPCWNDFEWGVARAVAAMQGITVLLARSLRWRGPESWECFLHRQHEQALQRDARIGAVIASVDSALREAGVVGVGLKGTMLRTLGLYGPAERPMGDVDLLVHPADADRTADALASVGFEITSRMRRHVVFEPRVKSDAPAFGEHPDNPIKVEVHTTVSEPLPMYPVDITSALMKPGRAGINPYPHARELMRHLLLHAAGNIRSHALRQIQLHDIALLAPLLRTTDWHELRDTPVSHGGSWWMWPVLQLTARYHPGGLPAGISIFRDGCPRWLRTAAARADLTTVSWSNLRISAFPGACWSRSAAETFSYAASRILPGRQALRELDMVRRVMTTLDQVPWYGKSHWSRISRWVFSRPPRVHTMMCVRAALAEVREST